jgi:EAL domain-containing protein (putative c-di-GMP-specific phosphodiesterase class I)/GGDEF domain-containing protein
MRLRHILFLLLALGAQIPVIAIGGWVRTYLEDVSQADVQDRHLLLARNLAGALARHTDDITTALRLLADGPRHMLYIQASSALHARLGFRSVCVVQLEPVALLDAAGAEYGRCKAIAEPSFVARLNALPSADNETVLSRLLDSPAEGRSIFAVHRHFGKIVIGEVSTSRIQELAATVKFGRMGHAAITDQTGAVLAHPKKDWVASAFSIDALEPVKLALSGKSGVTTFFSPALKTEMVAGYAGVPSSGWAVMVPQPMAEIELKIYDALKPIYFTLAIGLIAALVLAYGAAGRIARPLERITAAALRADSLKSLVPIEEETRAFVPQEQRAIVAAFNGMVRSIHASEAKVRVLAYTDSLTGLLNRAAFTTMAESLLARGAGGVLYYFDIDDFKTVNDTRGHSEGDLVLKSVGDGIGRLLDARFGGRAGVDALSGGNDARLPIFARFGGDEFVLLVPQAMAREEIDAFAVAMGAASRLAQPSTDSSDASDGEAIQISIGAAAFDPAGFDTLDAILQRADAAVYHAKARGKARHCVYAPEEGVRSIHDIRAEVAAAIANDEMLLHYQPKVISRSGEVRSVEALVRWIKPAEGLVQPAAFIPAIEDSPVIIALGEWVMRAAAADILKWRAKGLDLTVAINIASRHYETPGFPERMTEIARACGVEPSSLILEVTEEAAMSPSAAAEDVIAELKRSGFQVALDDYGRGYSNLQRLAQIKVDAIKIDRSLIAHVNDHDRTLEIVAATVAMAEALDCRVIAEGIENSAHAATLRQLGCHELQGFFFARPMPAEALETWLAERAANPVGRLAKRIVAPAA